jgi:hypothetical protein
VAGAAHVAVAPGGDVVVGADLVRRGVRVREVLALESLAELVVQPLGAEVPLLLGDPFMEPEVRGDEEFGHLAIP